jgi:hypothetical protein
MMPALVNICAATGVQAIPMVNEKDGRPAKQAPRGRSNASMPAKTRSADSSVEKAIGSRLRAYYDEMAREPVPDRFVELLKRLDNPEPGKG